MPFLKKFTSFLLIILAVDLISCKDDTSLDGFQCSWPKGTKISYQIDDFETTILKEQSEYYFYYAHGSSSYLGKYFVCNLPNEAKKDSLAVTISGYVMETPDTGGLKPGYPFEMTTITY